MAAMAKAPFGNASPIEARPPAQARGSSISTDDPFGSDKIFAGPDAMRCDLGNAGIPE